MTLIAKEIDKLPPLAWLAAMPNGSANVTLLHGRNVEHFVDGFFEGAWDGDFAEAGFDRAVNVFGSGGRIGGQTALFVPCSHILEPLYCGTNGELRAVSNSLSFVLHYCRLRLDPNHSGYGAVFSSIVKGLDTTPLTVPLRGGTLTLVHHHNIILGPGREIEMQAKPVPPRFANYGDYLSYLRSVVGRVFKNAGDTSRKYRYLPIATITSGYDSGAAAVVARHCGCEESIGLAVSNKGSSDSGAEAAQILGLKHIQFTALPPSTEKIIAEAEFLAPGMQGEDLFFSAFPEKLHGRILTTGVHGGVVWGKNHTPTSNVRCLDLSGCSLGEFRIRTNFLHLPVAFIGCQSWPDIHRISNSAEMKKYSVGGGYDRPVPRRILEDAGVPRAMVGQSKKAASILLFQGRNHLSAEARESIAAYCKREGLYHRYIVAFYPWTLWWMFGRTLYGGLRRFGRLFREGKFRHRLANSRNQICASVFHVQAPVFGARHPRYTILLTWAVSQIDSRYAVIPREYQAPAQMAAE
jgi:hypothetical protein